MIDYQFNFFTSITVLAGFSFTALGILLSLNNDYVMKQLKNTAILNSLYLNLLKSICFLVCSSMISLIFIWNIFETENIRLALYSIECFLVILGIGYFLVAIFVMGKILKKMFPKNKTQKDRNKKEFDQAKKRVKEHRQRINDTEENDEW